MPAGLNWKFGYETLGLYPMLLSPSRFEQCIVVAELRFRRSFNYEFKIYVCRQVLFICCGWFLNLHFTKDQGEGESGPRRRNVAIRYAERVIAPRHGYGRRELPNRSIPTVA